MRRNALAIAALLLAGCPIPQPLPDYPPGTITPPRILLATVTPASESLIRVGADCPPGANEPSFELTAKLFDPNNIEQVVARWFVNYDVADPVSQSPIGGDHSVPADGDSLVFIRTVPDSPFGRGFAFRPFLYRPPLGTGTQMQPPFNEPGTVRVVELLVSNAFHQPEPSVPPYRQPAANFEVQLLRWVFVLVPGIENCGEHPAP